MAAIDIEQQLISKVLRETHDIVPLLDRSLAADHFKNPEWRAVFKVIVKHYNEYGSVPSTDAVARERPNAEILPRRYLSDPVEYLIDEVIRAHKDRLFLDMVEEATAAYTKAGDSELGAARIRAGMLEYDGSSAAKSHDKHLSDAADADYQAYLERAERGTDMLGIPTGFTIIDRATGGLQPGQLIVLVAPPKLGKSTIALKTSINVHQAGHEVVFTSFEMSNTEQTNRHHAIRSGVSHTRLTRGKLDKIEHKRFKTMLDTLPEGFYLTDAAEGMTISAVQAKVAKYQPKLLVIDGVYLMHDEVSGERNTPQALTNITRNLKAFAQRNDIPVIITTQALGWKMRGSKVTSDSIGYSSSFLQDADVLLGLEYVEEDDDTSRRLKILASRNSGLDETELSWDWDCSSFQELGGAA